MLSCPCLQVHVLLRLVDDSEYTIVASERRRCLVHPCYSQNEKHKRDDPRNDRNGLHDHGRLVTQVGKGNNPWRRRHNRVDRRVKNSE